MKRLVIPVCTFLLVTAFTWGGDQKADDKKASDKKWVYIDLQPKANHKLGDIFHANAPEGNNLAELPRGELTLEDVSFKIGEKYIQLGSKKLPAQVAKVEGLQVGKKCGKLHFLHATGWGAEDGTIIGEYVVTWEDDSSVTIPMRYGKDLVNWWNQDADGDPSEAKVAWRGENEASRARDKKIRLYLSSWENPKPEKKIKSIDCTSTKETEAAPFCVAITGE